MKINKHIEIARTSQAPYSSMGDASALRIQAVLSEHYEEVGISIVDTSADLEILVRKKPDLVFLGLKKLPSLGVRNDGQVNDVWISEYLDQRGVSYTGSSKAATKLDFNKAEAKVRVRSAGLSTAPFFTSLPGSHPSADSLPLPFPLFIKPLNCGGGNGVGEDSVVRNFSEFQDKVGTVFNQFGSSSLVEKYLTGREFSVAILEDVDCGDLAVMPIEIITEQNSRGDRVLGSIVKHEDNEQVIAVDEAGTRDMLSSFAKVIYEVLGARDLARIDIRMDEQGAAYFLEANFMPAPGSRYFAGAFQINDGMDYESVILAIAGLGLSRSEDVEQLLARAV
ncbi:MAG TPA: hypothetical protein VMR18_03585 [Candidatus Saccharimonadales bacterium]|nr:hypothetical protein [Candidatus Saccharimonadales bacterium]